MTTTLIVVGIALVGIAAIVWVVFRKSVEPTANVTRPPLPPSSKTSVRNPVIPPPPTLPARTVHRHHEDISEDVGDGVVLMLAADLLTDAEPERE